MNQPNGKRTARAVAVLVSLSALLAAGSPQPPQSPEASPPGAKKAAAGPQTRCAPLSGEVIPAEKVLADLKDGKSVSLKGKTIEGSLDADTIFPEADTRKTSLRMIRGLRLDSCRITGRVALRHCVFAQEVSFTCSEILGDLDLSDSEVRGAIKAERIHVASDVRLVNATVDGDLLFRGATVQGPLDFSGGRLHRVYLGDADLGGVSADHAMLQTLDMATSKLSGSVRLSDVFALESITASNTSFGRGLSLSSVRVGGPFQLGWASVSGGVSLSDVAVEGDLVLPHLFDGPTTLSDVTVGRNFLLENGELQDVTIERLKVGGFTKMEGGRFTGKVVIGESDFGKTFNASQTVFSGDCEFRKVLFPGDNPMAGAVFTRKPTLIETQLLHDPAVKTDGVDEDESEAEPQDDENP